MTGSVLRPARAGITRLRVLTPDSLQHLTSSGFDLRLNEFTPVELLGLEAIVRRAERPKTILVVSLIHRKWQRMLDFKAGTGATACPVGAVLFALKARLVQNPLPHLGRYVARHRGTCRFVFLGLLLARGSFFPLCLSFSPPLLFSLRVFLLEEGLERCVEDGWSRSCDRCPPVGEGVLSSGLGSSGAGTFAGSSFTS